MSEISVLGASDRNKKAIQLALTLSGPSTKNGSAIADRKYKEEVKSKATELQHPWKLSFISDEEDPSIKYLSINKGRITVCFETNSRCYALFYDEFKLELDALSDDSEYLVFLAVQYDENGAKDEFDNRHFKCNAFFLTSPSTTNNVPGVPGFQCIIIGRIKRQTVDEKVIWSVVEQALFSDLFLDYNALLKPFSITASSSSWTNGCLKNSYDLSDFSFSVQPGNVIFGENLLRTSLFNFTANANTYVYCSINEDPPSAFINPQNAQIPFHDGENKRWNHLIGLVQYEQATLGLVIRQFMFQEIGSGLDTFKVKSISEDIKPDFLSGKFIFEENEDEPASGYTSGLIGAELVSSSVSEPGLTGTQYKLRPVWMWKDIDDYDETKEQCLTNSKGDLKWAAGGIEVSGSLADWEEIAEVSGTRILRWRPEYDLDLLDDKFYFMASYKADGSLGEEGKHKLSGLTFGQDSFRTEKDGVLMWSRFDGEPFISIPPPSSELSKEWCLVGEQTSGIVWKPYKSGSDLLLSGSMENIFELHDSSSGQVLRVKSEYDNSIDQFHFLNLEADGTLSATSFFGDPQTDGIEGLMTWSYENLEPQILFCEEEIEEDDLVLAGSKETGFYWVPLLGTLSGDFYKVKVTDQDPSAGFLYDKVESSLSSINIDVDDDVEDYLDININPEYFYSSDESISIEETEDGLDFTLSGDFGKVKVTDQDPSANFLYDKVESSLSSINIDVDDDVEDYLDININPEYFYSSDQSISIEDTGEGLDFIISSYLVQVSENDESPDYLRNKIEVDSSIASLIALDDDGETLYITSALSGSGLLKVENGEISFLSPPQTGKFLLACEDGQFSWVPYADCEDACSEEE